MPLVIENVHRPAHDPTLPDALGRSAQLLAELNDAEVLEKLGSALRLNRKSDGYPGLPVVTFVLALLASGLQMGVRPFWKAYRGNPWKRLAAVAGLSSLPSSGSVGRALRPVKHQTAATFSDSVLTAIPHFDELLQHPAVTHRDRHGQRHHVLDIDPTVQAYRLRDLVEGDEYPEAERLAPGVRGYTGHHRGEVRIRHVGMCHAGAGVWVAYRVSDDNPHLSVFFEPILEQGVRVVASTGADRSFIVVRGDCEFGAAGILRTIVELGVHPLVRISRYNLLGRPEVQATLSTAVWEPVRSGAARTRQATDLGIVMLHPSSKSADAGQPGVAVRVVVARRKVNDASEASYGTVRDGYLYELFATTLAADRWSAADIVDLYAGRSVIENRFAQEDRELGLGRNFCYQAPGQAVFVATGLFLWNYWTCAGFQAHPPADTSSERPEQERAPDESVPVPDPEPTLLEDVDEPAVVPPADPQDPFPGALADRRETVVTVLGTAFRDTLRSPGWSLISAGYLECPNHKRLFPFSLAKVGPGRPRPQVIVRTDVGACDGCPLRAGCFASNRPNAYKQIARAISDDEATVLAEFLARHPPGRRQRMPASCATRPPRATPEQPQLPADELVRPPPTVAPGPRECSSPTFPATAARQMARNRHANTRIEIRISRRRRLEPEPTDLGRTRRTWAQRDARWRLDAHVRLICHLSCQPTKKRAGATL